MIQQSYEMLSGVVLEQKEKIIRDISQLRENTEKNIEKTADIQQEIIDFGNEMEQDFHLQDTKFLANLQSCCELLYEYSCSDVDGQMILEQLVALVSEWDMVFRESIMVEERGLSIVGIVFNEAPYIQEWLAFHFLQGVSHIYIYDNGSTDDTKELLRPYIEKGQVTYIWWSGKEMQLPAYNHALKNFKFDTKYMGFIDADEFLVPVKDMPLCEMIDRMFQKGDQYLENYGMRCGGIGVNWRLYGTSGHMVKPEGLVTENYTYRALDEYEMNAHIKTICNPRVSVMFQYQPHAVLYQEKYCCVSENGSYIPDAFFYDGICRWLRINHYYSKSEEELRQRLRRGKAC